MVPPALPPPLLLAPRIFEKMRGARRGPLSCAITGARVPLTVGRIDNPTYPCEGKLAKGISSLGWSSHTIGRVGAFFAVSRPDDSLNSFLITCLRAVLLDVIICGEKQMSILDLRLTPHKKSIETKAHYPSAKTLWYILLKSEK